MFTEKKLIFKILKKGFTLIELLVVISIIALLTAVVVGQLNGARAKARDRALLQQVHEIQNALELYRAKYGEYPDADPTSTSWQSYTSYIDSNGIWRQGGSTVQNYPNRLIDRLSEFLPIINPPKLAQIKYYNYGNVTTNKRFTWCSDLSNQYNSLGRSDAPPYTIWVTFEDETFKENFPYPVANTGTDYSYQSCFSLK